MYNNRDELLERTPKEARKTIAGRKLILSALFAGFKSIKLHSLFRKISRREAKEVREIKQMPIAKPVSGEKSRFRFPGININISIGRPSTGEERIETYTPKTIHELATPRPRYRYREVIVRPRIPLPFGDLRRMLARWKKVPVYATPPKEYSLRKAISEYLKRRKERKQKRELVRHERRRIRELKRARRKERRHIRKQARTLHKRLKKKQVGKHEIAGLKAQLKEWRRKGFSNTYKLEKKLDKI